MSAWRVGSKLGVTLFKGDELYGMLLTPEKAAVVASWLNLAVRNAEGDRFWLTELSDAELAAASDAVWDETVRRRQVRHGVEAGRGQAEGGAEGDHPAAGADGVRGAECPLGAGDGGDRAAGRDGGGAGE
jgi:hypothetical protein